MLTELRQYTTHTAQTATPGQLVVMLYDGFLRFAGQGKAAMERGDLGEAGHRLTRAQDIVTELRVSLDMTQGVVAQNLASIYDYVGERLTGARLSREPERITEAMRLHGRPAHRVGPDRLHAEAREHDEPAGGRRQPCWMSSAT